MAIFDRSCGPLSPRILSLLRRRKTRNDIHDHFNHLFDDHIYSGPFLYDHNASEVGFRIRWISTPVSAASKTPNKRHSTTTMNVLLRCQQIILIKDSWNNNCN
nr:uncharacterized protein LOC113801992 [Penaeus vannamei]